MWPGRSPGANGPKKRCAESESRFRSLFENMLNGFAYCQMLIEAGQPPDFIYLEVNQAFETLTGLKGAVGQKVSELIPAYKNLTPNCSSAIAGWP